MKTPRRNKHRLRISMKRTLQFSNHASFMKPSRWNRFAKMCGSKIDKILRRNEKDKLYDNIN